MSGPLELNVPEIRSRGGRSRTVNLLRGESRSTTQGDTIMMQNALDYPILAHCHLSWEGVWQRPQQFLSRLSVRHPVLFVEGPRLVDSHIEPRARLQTVPGYPNLVVVISEFPRSRFMDGEWVDEKRYELISNLIQNSSFRRTFRHPVQWFYDPMAVTAFAGRMNESAIVYDCMDELSQFRFAPPELVNREKELLLMADVVFAGGRKLHQVKKRTNNNCHFYGCGVEVEHFAKARLSRTKIPEDIRDLRGPIYGYFGVIDERLDYALIKKLAETNPHSHVVMIGPMAKIDPEQLPQAPNLHWLGRREYSTLPAYVKAFSVCLMPFELNEATEYINPTKALEYMASGRPIVSTPISDVVTNFGDVVQIADSSDKFISLCRQAVDFPNLAAVDRGLKMANQNTWDMIVAKLEQHIAEALSNKALVQFAASKQRLTASTH